MTTYKRGLLTIKNFGNDKKAMLAYFNNISSKPYVKNCGCGYRVADTAYCVEICYYKK